MQVLRLYNVRRFVLYVINKRPFFHRRWSHWCGHFYQFVWAGAAYYGECFALFYGEFFFPINSLSEMILFQLYASKDLTEIMTKIKDVLSNTNEDWEKRVEHVSENNFRFEAGYEDVTFFLLVSSCDWCGLWWSLVVQKTTTSSSCCAIWKSRCNPPFRIFDRRLSENLVLQWRKFSCFREITAGHLLGQYWSKNVLPWIFPHVPSLSLSLSPPILPRRSCNFLLYSSSL